MEFIVRPEAEADLADAFDWYGERDLEVKKRFIARVESILERIQTRPKQFLIAMEGLRRAAMGDFPYSVYFRLETDAVIIFAVLHQRRDLSALDDRLN